jgi:hypothetical protein
MARRGATSIPDLHDPVLNAPIAAELATSIFRRDKWHEPDAKVVGSDREMSDVVAADNEDDRYTSGLRSARRRRFGRAPTTWEMTSPFLKTLSVGIASIPYRCAVT